MTLTCKLDLRLGQDEVMNNRVIYLCQRSFCCHTTIQYSQLIDRTTRTTKVIYTSKVVGKKVTHCSMQTSRSQIAVNETRNPSSHIDMHTHAV